MGDRPAFSPSSTLREMGRVSGRMPVVTDRAGAARRASCGRGRLRDRKFYSFGFMGTAC
jgi:hypothetical protein